MRQNVNNDVILKYAYMRDFATCEPTYESVWPPIASPLPKFWFCRKLAST